MSCDCDPNRISDQKQDVLESNFRNKKCVIFFADKKNFLMF